MIAGPLSLIVLGFTVGTIGTIIGSGGGFLLVPVLLLLDPQIQPDMVTAISLAVVFCNAVSGSVAYARMNRIDYRAGILFAAAAIPGAVVGTYVTARIPRHVFDLVFGSLMIVVSIYLVITAGKKMETKHPGQYNRLLGIVISVGVGFLSSLLGIGGGIIHVPALTQALKFPVHIATATSHFVLSITTLVATLIHFRNGALRGEYGTILWISIGAIAGAQAGAKLSNEVRGQWILRLLAAGLSVIGIRILLPLF